MTGILGALGAGYSSTQVLRYLAQHNPRLSQQITAALNAGHTIDHVMNFLTRNQKRMGNLLPEKEKKPKSNNLYKTAQSSIHPSLKGMASAGILAAGAVGAGYALKHALPTNLIAPGMQGNIPQVPNVPNQPIPGAPNQPQATGMLGLNPQAGQQTPPQTSHPPVNAPTIPQTQQITQPINAQRDIQKNIDIIKNVGADVQVKNLIEGGLPTQDIAGALRKILPKEKVKALESAEGGLEQAIEDMRQSPKEEMKNVEETQIAPQELQNMEPEIQELDVPEETPKIDVKSIVGTPNGIGEVKAIRNGKTIVEVDGKRHQINENELIASPLSEKDLADLYDDVISRIEKETGQQVSRNVDWAGYDPKTKELAYKPHGSDRMWTYDDLTQEDVDELTNLLTQRKTTGENYIGAWESGSTSPIGAALSKLIQRLQKERGGKGNEYKNRYDTIYDALAPAKSAAKRKHAELKKKAKKPKST